MDDDYNKLERAVLAESSTESSEKNSNARNQSQLQGPDQSIDELLRQAAEGGENEHSMQIELA